MDKDFGIAFLCHQNLVCRLGMAMEHTCTATCTIISTSNFARRLSADECGNCKVLSTAGLFEDFAEYCNTAFTGSLGISPHMSKVYRIMESSWGHGVAEWPRAHRYNHGKWKQLQATCPASKSKVMISHAMQPSTMNPFYYTVISLYLFNSFISCMYCFVYFYVFRLFASFRLFFCILGSFRDLSGLHQVSPQHDETCHDFIF